MGGKEEGRRSEWEEKEGKRVGVGNGKMSVDLIQWKKLSSWGIHQPGADAPIESTRDLSSLTEVSVAPGFQSRNISVPTSS